MQENEGLAPMNGSSGVFEVNPLGLIASFTRGKNLKSRCRYIMFLLATVSLVVVAFSTDIEFPSDSSRFNTTVGVLMLLTSVCGCVCSVLLFVQANQSLRNADVTWRNMRSIESPYLPACVVEMAVWCIHCPPGCESLVSNAKLLNAFSLLRFYVVFILFKDVSPINQFKARSMVYFARMRLDASLVLRTQLNQQPTLTLSLVYCLFALVLGTFFAILEGHTFEQSVWFIFVTSTTVGYGDMFPTTPGGRIVAAIATIIGLLLVGFIVGTVQQLLALSSDEKAIFNYMDLHAMKQKLKEDSAVVLQRYWRFRRQPSPSSTWKLSAAMLLFRSHRIQLNQARRSVESQKVHASSESEVAARLGALESHLDQRLRAIEARLSNL